MRDRTSRRRLLALGAFAAAGLAAPSLMRAQSSLGAVLDEAEALDQLRAIRIVQDGALAAERVVRGPPADRAVPIKSVSKTLVATLLGIAVERGVVAGVGAPLSKVAPSLIPAGADPRVGAITLEDLVTLRAGLERMSGPNYGGWVSSPDWVAHALSRPFTGTPGEDFLYSTASTHVLGAALSVAAGRSLLELMRGWIGDPLGIEIPPWSRDPQGRYLGGNEMALRLAAMTRFGEAYRTGGGAAIPPGWIEAAWTPRARSPFSGDSYGYGWFLRGRGRDQAAYARGYGGQMIWVAPERRLTVAITSDPNRPARTRGHFGALLSLVETRLHPLFA